jgi:hypothetical protein
LLQRETPALLKPLAWLSSTLGIRSINGLDQLRQFGLTTPCLYLPIGPLRPFTSSVLLG